MADKKLNELGTADRFDNAYVELSQNQYRISKTNLGKQLTNEVHTSFSATTSKPDYIFVERGNVGKRISLRDLSKSIIDDGSTFYGNYDGNRPLYDGCFIMYHEQSSGVPCAVPYRSWTTLQNNGEEADGVLIVEGGHSLVIAPHEKDCYWSSKDGLASQDVVPYTSDNRIKLLDIWDGKERTAKICTDASSPFKFESTNISTRSTYAPGYCYNYTPHVASDGGVKKKGLSAGKYWLPCIAELFMIYTHLHKINAGLALIAGATPLKKYEGHEWYWSSTETNDTYAWRLSLSTGSYAENGIKSAAQNVSPKHMVRPVSSFIDDRERVRTCG